jgi:hypothetical protein
MCQSAGAVAAYIIDCRRCRGHHHNRYRLSPGTGGARPALVFATTTAAIAGGIYGLQQAEDAQDGLIASLVPAVAELQKSVGLVAAKVENIEKTVTQTQETVTETKAGRRRGKTIHRPDRCRPSRTDEAGRAATAIDRPNREQSAKAKKAGGADATNQVEQTKQIEQLNTTTEKIAVSIDTIAKGFATLAANGGAITDPKTAG